MNGEVASKFLELTDKAASARADLKDAIVEELGTAPVFATMFAKSDRGEVARLLIQQVQSFRDRDAAAAADHAAREAAEAQTAAAIEHARDKRSVDEVRADRIRHEMKDDKPAKSDTKPAKPTEA
jgi:hypothetical protein